MKKARARQHEPGRMNKTEEAYSKVLEARKLAGEIVDYKFEAIKFRLAEKTTYTPDFFVTTASGYVEFHECKGSWKAPYQEDARVKIKVVAEMYPQFIFRSFSQVAKKLGGGWKMEVF